MRSYKAPSEKEGRERQMHSAKLELSGPYACSVHQRWNQFVNEQTVDGDPLNWVLGYFFVEGHDEDFLDMEPEEIEELPRKIHDELKDPKEDVQAVVEDMDEAEVEDFLSEYGGES